VSGNKYPIRWDEVSRLHMEYVANQDIINGDGERLA
jgi:hypothetical protein